MNNTFLNSLPVTIASEENTPSYWQTPFAITQPSELMGHRRYLFRMHGHGNTTIIKGFMVFLRLQPSLTGGHMRAIFEYTDTHGASKQLAVFFKNDGHSTSTYIKSPTQKHIYILLYPLTGSKARYAARLRNARVIKQQAALKILRKYMS